MAGLGGPILEAYAGGYDPDRYRRREENVVYYNPKDWSEDEDDGEEEEAE